MKKMLEKKLEQTKRRNGQLMDQVGAMRKEVKQTREGMAQLVIAENTILANVAIAYGKEKYDDETGEFLGWNLDIPNTPLAEITAKYEFRCRKDPNTGHTIVGILPRDLAFTERKLDTKIREKTVEKVQAMQRGEPVDGD